MALVAVVLAVLLTAAPATAVNYVVGDGQGWTTGVNYNSWASGKTFNVGDTLEFQYGPLHSVNEVSSSDFSSCSVSNAINSYTNMDSKIQLTSPGTRYFVCGTAGHCSQGMKLAVTVSGSGNGSPSSNSPSSPNNNAAATGGIGGNGVLVGALVAGGLALVS